MMGGGGMMGGSGFGGLGLIGGILNLLISVGVIIGIVLLAAWLIRKAGANGGAFWAGLRSAGSQPAPREVLQARYARGEITREQYQQMVSDIG